MYLALRKCKNDCKILKIILVLIFVHKNLKLLDFLSDFVLSSLFLKIDLYVWIYESGAKDFDSYHPYFTLISLNF